MELYFKGATLRRAPKVFQRCTSTMYHVGGHGASKDAVKGHHKRGYVWMLIVVVFLFFFWMVYMLIV